MASTLPTCCTARTFACALTANSDHADGTGSGNHSQGAGSGSSARRSNNDDSIATAARPSAIAWCTLHDDPDPIATPLRDEPQLPRRPRGASRTPIRPSAASSSAAFPAGGLTISPRT